MKFTTKDGEVLEIPMVEKTEIPHSCEIHVNAKGEYYGEVKAYAETPIKAVIDATEAMDILKVYLEGKNKSNHRI